MQDFSIIVAVALLLAFIICAPLYLYHDHIGSSAARERRKAEIIQSFDGRLEVVVRAAGTGLSREETVLLARQYGYEFWKWETYNRTGLYMRMRRAQFPHPPPPLENNFPPAYPYQPYGEAPFQQNQPIMRPGAEIPTVRHQLNKAPGTWTWRRTGTILSLLATGTSLTTVIDIFSGSSFTAPGSITIALSAGALISFAINHSLARRAPNAKDATHGATPPTPGNQAQ
ncbi:hypothetical protein [Streptomyces pinistramenti]|uniref:hypothetical protein n=1 Tax=Streptomyces pinistramenti TaxID=2884812 RepID=UPI001D076DDE|nr:hypothetical protein [Streptomyces pinistramenti]MCB5909747.1 hypothetical protein [Streptomyces pinistramenti]